MARVLLIDDDKLVRNWLRAALVQAGHVVMTAADGRQGIRSFRSEPADVVITDIVMPDQDGTGVLMELRGEFPDVPFIVISGHAAYSALYLDVARKLGARRTLTKPFPIEAILRAVEDVGRETVDRKTRARDAD